MDYLQVAAIKAEKTGIEITARGVNKGQALIFLVNYLQLEIEQTIAVGDGDNDRQ
ncbi:HMP-PP phosphatase [Streptococcus dysgalactiae subsp. equisimilis]|nr:HMP-PP phosphatase [Streptococcus dysgalactiae subsp. equisimilis]